MFLWLSVCPDNKDERNISEKAHSRVITINLGSSNRTKLLRSRYVLQIVFEKRVTMTRSRRNNLFTQTENNKRYRGRTIAAGRCQYFKNNNTRNYNNIVARVNDMEITSAEKLILFQTHSEYSRVRKTNFIASRVCYLQKVIVFNG